VDAHLLRNFCARGGVTAQLVRRKVVYPPQNKGIKVGTPGAGGIWNSIITQWRVWIDSMKQP
jgi:hypothetical protein